MAATTAQPNGDVPNFKIISKLDGVPAIHDSVAYAEHLINSTSLTAQLYATACGVATKSYNLATPVLSRTKPLLESADGLAVATFDRAEKTFPYPFQTPTQDLVVVKQAKAVYDARILPAYHNVQPVLQDLNNKAASITSALNARAVATVQGTQDLSHALVEQMKHLTEHGRDLPGILITNLSKTSDELKQILLAKDQSLQEKGNKLSEYVLDHVKPVMDEVYNYVLGAKKKAQEEADKASNHVNGQ